MKIQCDYSGQAGIKEYKITADNSDEEKHLLEVRDKIIELLGSSTTMEETQEVADGGIDQILPEGTTDSFRTGGC